MEQRRRTSGDCLTLRTIGFAVGMALVAGLPSPASAQGNGGSGGAGGNTLPGLLPPPAETSNPVPGGPGAGGQAAATGNARRGPQGIERRIQEWHDRLRITPAQESQWNAFAAVMRENLQRAQAVRAERRQAAATGAAAGTAAPGSALDDLRSFARAAQARAQSAQGLVGPFEALYNSLSPEQRRAADQAFRGFEEREARGRRRPS